MHHLLLIILINNVGVDSHVKFMTRIGEKSSNKNRPTKVVIGSAHRYLLMKNLANLKGKSTYKGISITENVTVFERSLIMGHLMTNYTIFSSFL